MATPRKGFAKPNDLILVQKAKKISLKEINSKKTQAIIKKMLAYAYGEQKDRKKPILVGLAAPQVKISKRIILVDVKAEGHGVVGDLRVFINPEIVWKSKERQEWYEGCFSTDRVCGIVSRPKSVKVRAYTRDGERVEEKYTGYVARIFQHEIDHLNGKEFITHITDDGKLHWVEDSQFPLYRDKEAWRTWPHKCPREKWEEIKGIRKITSYKVEKLMAEISKLYKKHTKYLLFHGWHHINFVTKKSVEFAKQIKADNTLVRSAALTHDLNYIVTPNSEPEVAKDLRNKILTKCGYSNEEIKRIESIIGESHMRTRSEEISEEGKALADADTLFKALPITPILFASKYITQNKVDIYKLARKVTEEQNPKMEKGIYFYTKAAQKYLPWAKANLAMWNCVQESLQDKDVREVISIAQEAGVI